MGGKHPIKVDIRIIAATNKDLRQMVSGGKFREDLYYRLEVIPLMLPPLRQRKEDIPLLVDHFIQKFNRNNTKQIRGVSSHTMGVLLRYHWPGNVRELENCVERAAVMSDGDILDVTDLTQILRPAALDAARAPVDGRGRNVAAEPQGCRTRLDPQNASQPRGQPDASRRDLGDQPSRPALQTEIAPGRGIHHRGVGRGR